MASYPLKQHALGFMQLDPLPSVEVLNEFYQSRYYDLLRKDGRAAELRRLMDVGGERDEELNWLRATLYQDVVSALCAHENSGEVLDVGCGTGDFVQFLQEQGYTSSGIEPSFEAVSAAQERGLTAHCSTLESWTARPENIARYQAITLLNVLEHVPDPLAVLGLLRSMLAPGGILLFRVPNDFTELQTVAEQQVQRKHWWVSAPDHINYFRADSATALCASVGLEVLDITVDFPMEFFLLMGINYIDQSGSGAHAHQMRRNFELAMPQVMRQTLYRCFADLGMGRNILVVAQCPSMS